MVRISRSKAKYLLDALIFDMNTKYATDDVVFGLESEITVGNGFTIHGDSTYVGIGIRGLFSGWNHFKVDIGKYVDAVVAVYHEAAHVEQQLSGDKLMAMTEVVQYQNDYLYRNTYCRNPREIQAEMKGIMDAHRRLQIDVKPGGFGLVLDYVNRKASNKNCDYFVRCSGDTLFTNLAEVRSAFRDANERALLNRMWYQSYAGKNNKDLIRDVLEIGRPEYSKKWDPIYDEILASKDFSDSVGKLCALGCYAKPDDMDIYPDLWKSDKEMLSVFENLVPETKESLRRRITAGPDSPRDYVSFSSAVPVKPADDIANVYRNDMLAEAARRRQKQDSWHYDVKRAIELCGRDSPSGPGIPEPGLDF